LSISACGQDIRLNAIEEENWQYRVKQLDEFIKRFNYHIDKEGKVVTKLDMPMRKRYILALFDENLFKKPNDTLQNQVKSFVNQVCGDSSKFILIDFYDKDWYAETLCKVKWKGKDAKIRLFLRAEKTDQVARWSIVGIDADFINLKAKDTTTFLTPVSHELNFMQLSKTTTQDKANIANYMGNTHEPDALSVFIYLVKNGELTIDYVEDITYHFLQVQNWIFKVKHFERKSDNVGWLISELKPMTEKEKFVYRQTVLKLFNQKHIK
jgi:hypothetical protein